MHCILPTQVLSSIFTLSTPLGVMCHHEARYNDFKNEKIILRDHVEQTSDDVGVARGGNGVILRGILISEQDRPAVGIKRLFTKADDVGDGMEKVTQALQREIAIWCTLEDRNVLLLLGIVVLTPTLHNYLPISTVFYYYTHGDLKEYGARMKPSALEILKLLRDTAAGLSHIHKLSIVHGDLKDVNVVIEQPGKARVCDFGSAHILGCANCIAGPPDVFDSLVTQRYLSPEIRRSGNFQTTKQSDVWALGCVLLEVQTGAPPYKSNGDNAFGWVLKQLKGDYPAERSVFVYNGSIAADVGEIAFRCWERDPDKRPPAQRVLEDLEHLCIKYDVPEVVPQ